jgi:DNA polymerase I
MVPKKLFVVDGSSYLYRAFYAISGLSNSKGFPTNAVFGVTNMMLKLVKDENPDFICVCFDLPGPTFRHESFAEYKAQRKPTPEGLITQIPRVKEVISALGMEILEYAGFEADDLMAALARLAESQNIETILVTGDKDILQLVSPKTFVMRINPNGTEIYDENMVIEKYGVAPRLFPDVIGLIGDTVDNIPGVPGIGEKTSRILLQQFGTLENLLAHAEEIKNVKQRELLKQYADQARKSRELATLNPDVPVELDMDTFRRKPIDSNRIRELFRELEFNKLLDQLGLPSETKTVSQQRIESSKDMQTFISQLISVGEASIAMDTESSMVAFYVSGNSYIFERQKLSSLFLDNHKPHFKLYGFDSKHTLNQLHLLKLSLPVDWFDISIAGYLITPQRGNPTLSSLSLEYLGRLFQTAETSNELDFDQAKTEESLSKQAQAIFEIGKIVEPLLKEKNLEKLFNEIEMPLVHVLADMESRGIKVDVPYLKSLTTAMTHQINRLAQDIYTLAGEEFNINSPKQLAKLLFEKLKLPVGKKTKTKSGYSTNVEVLEELASVHPLPEKILEYRTLTKVQSTYIDALIQQAKPDTHTIHTSFQQTVANTGRIISSEPNLQNLPIHSEWGDKIRECFIPRNDTNLFLSADYSQIELRILAHLSGDTALKNAFCEKKDIHTETATQMFKVAPPDVTPQMRRAAKAINFGIIYGMSAFGLSKSLKINHAEAQEYIDTYFQRYPKVKAYLDELRKFARDNGYVTTIFGRRCYVPDIQSSQAFMREAAERQAINAPIQGSAADMLKLAMIHIDNRLAKESLQSLLLLTIHDELVFESPKTEIDPLKILVKKEMESAMELSVPIIVEINVGKNLAEC